MAMQEEEKTLVLWNISSCPIPTGYDPRQISARIVSALKSYGVSGSVTITAIGRLTHNLNSPDNNVLRELSSSGIALIHADELRTCLYHWIKKNPGLANIMIISGPNELEVEDLARTLDRLESIKYPILLAYPQRPAALRLNAYKEWLWTSLLTDESADNEHLTTRLVLQDKCTETGETPWYCSVCDFAGQTFEDFNTHLKSEKHARLASDESFGAPKGEIMATQEDEEIEEENEEFKTLVLWNISSCPIPPCYDPRQVGQRIVSALKNDFGVCGIVTITAIGRLTHSPNAPDNDVLRELSSTGIGLIHANELQTYLCDWTKKNAIPANIMIISGPNELEVIAPKLFSLDIQLYNILLAYPQRHPSQAWLWKSFLSSVCKEWLWTRLLTDDMESGSAGNKRSTTRLLPQDKCSGTGESPWCCSECHFVGQSFEDFTTHLNSEEHNFFHVLALNIARQGDEEKEAEKEVKTLVWWNISSCPIPPGCDPSEVGPRMVSALKNSGVSGPVTITAIGQLTSNLNSPDIDVLRKLSASGIALTHANDLVSGLFKWKKKNPAPANILFISGHNELELLATALFGLVNGGYNILLAYPQRHPAQAWLWKSYLRSVSKEWLWTRLLTDDMESGSAGNKQLTTRLLLQDKCSETGESPWYCSSVCDFVGKSFEDFSTHLKSEKHALEMVAKPFDAFDAFVSKMDMVNFSQLKGTEEAEVEEDIYLMPHLEEDCKLDEEEYVHGPWGTVVLL